MSIADWDKGEIRKAAHASGKPLEVRCADAFLKARWRVSLGTFYVDVASEKIRELDFLAEMDFPLQGLNANQDIIEWKLRLRILGSCKGFPPEHGPVMFSVSPSSLIVKRPSLMCYECGIHGHAVAERMKRRSAEIFLHFAQLRSAQQVIGFDILQRREEQRKTGAIAYSENRSIGLEGDMETFL